MVYDYSQNKTNAGAKIKTITKVFCLLLFFLPCKEYHVLASSYKCSNPNPK